MSNADLKPGDRAFWWNTIACENRPVTIVKVRRGKYVVRTDDGQTYSPSRSMVSREAVAL